MEGLLRLNAGALIWQPLQRLTRYSRETARFLSSSFCHRAGRRQYLMITKGRDVSRYAIALALLIFTCAALAAVQPQTLQGEIMFLDRETGRMWLRPQGAKAARPGKDVIVFVLPDTELRRGKAQAQLRATGAGRAGPCQG